MSESHSGAPTGPHPAEPAPRAGGRPAGSTHDGSSHDGEPHAEAPGADGYVEDDHTSTSPVGPLLVGGGLLVLGVLLLTQVWAIKADGFSPEGPRFFPLVVLSLLTVLAGVYLVQQLLAVSRSRERQHAERFDHMLAAGVLVVLLVVYAFVLNPLGYVLATAAFMLAACRTLGSRNLVRDVVVAVGLSLVVYLVFTRALGVFLPEGVLPL